MQPEPGRTATPAQGAAIHKSVSIIAPAYNERDNIRPLILALDRAMAGDDWELVVVDDDSPDRTFEVVEACAREGWPVRCIRRVGRRGLASAVVEGALSCLGDHLVVMDADLQHDEAVIPAMLDQLRYGGAELVVASRHAPGGGLGEWSAERKRMSALATRTCAGLVGSRLSDPMSGFFAIRREVFLECVYDLSQEGYKILLDIVASSRRSLKIAETPYVFRARTAGESKLDTLVIVEFGLLMIDKATSGLVSPKLLMFLLVGACGLVCHLGVLRAALVFGQPFVDAQVVATLTAMTLNYLMNNALTYRAERLKGQALAWGYLVFCAICSLGVVANVSVANMVLSHGQSWPIAGVAGALMSAVFNFEVGSRLVWSGNRRRRKALAATNARSRSRAIAGSLTANSGAGLV